MGNEKPDELVLCVPSAEVDSLFRGLGDKGPEGFIARPVWLPGEGWDFGGWLFEHAEFRRRSKVEGDESVRHLATYAILTSGVLTFTYLRGPSGGEARLHRMLSLGVGGHVGIGDYHPNRLWDEMLRDAAMRELREEMEPVDFGDLVFVGLIAANDSAVDRVHLGVAYRFRCDPDEPRPSPRESCLAEPLWMSGRELRHVRDGMENWSKIVLDRFITAPFAGPAPAPAEPGPPTRRGSP
jgi:predicted NUDIX family phosphoesterase